MAKKQKKRVFLFFLLLLIFILGASFFILRSSAAAKDGVLAQEKELEVRYPTVPGAEKPYDIKTPLPQYFKYILNFLLSLVGLFIFGVLVYGGFKYLTSGHSPVKLADAKKQIFAAFLGLAIILSSYLILYTINPQLVIFRMPEWVKVELPPFVSPPPLGEQTIYAKEIPTGKLIDGIGEELTEEEKEAGGSLTSPYYEYEGVLAETRLERIKKLSKEVWDASKNVQKKSEEIQKVSEEILAASEEMQKLLSRCNCRYCNPNCQFRDQNCVSVCSGDPCSERIGNKTVRGLINAQQGIIRAKTLQLPSLKTELGALMIVLKEKVEKLAIEQEKLKNALAELERAEQIMKECPRTLSDQGKDQFLLNSDNFWQYKRVLKEQKIVKSVERQPLWEYVKTGDDTFVFYCMEAPFDVSLLEEEIFLEELGEEFPEIETIKTTETAKVYCETEIPVGRVIDDTEDIAQRLIDEFQKIIDEVSVIEDAAGRMPTVIDQEIADTDRTIELPQQYVCIGKFYPYGHIYFGPCFAPCDLWPRTGPPSACVPTGSFCYGSPPPVDPYFKDSEGAIFGAIRKDHTDIQTIHLEITESYQKITASYLKIVGYNKEIEEEIERLKGEEYEIIKELENAEEIEGLIARAYEILKKLAESRKKFGKCVNTAEEWTRAIFGEKILEKTVLTCEEAKVICWDLPENYQCYGEGDPEAYTNYFCGEVLTP